jgi:hypothetical protein
VILAESALVWYRVLRGKKEACTVESPYVPTQFAAEEA